MQYVVTTPATFFAGVLGLTEIQAQPRLAYLRNLGGGLYEVIAPVQFKAGEVIEVEPHAPKAMGDTVRALPGEVLDVLQVVPGAQRQADPLPDAPAPAKRAPRKPKA
jgi:hypothetical protein